MLSIQNLTASRGQGEQAFAVSLPTLQITQGEAVALCGVSGCGKSTLLEAIGLILTPSQLQSYMLSDAGNITPLIQQHRQHDLAFLRSKYIGFMLQTGGLLPFLTVKENIALPNQLLQTQADQDWINSLIESLNIQHLLNSYPRALSIGERQRVAFIRAIAHKPALLLADEPTAALDYANANRLFDLILGEVSTRKIATIIVTHDLNSVKHRGIRTFFAEYTGTANHTIFKEREGL